MNYRNQKGQALVETALSIFLLFLIVFGITEFGRAMFHWNSLNNAARAGARKAVVTQGLTTAVVNPLACPYTCPGTGNDCVYEAVCNSLSLTGDFSVEISGVGSPLKTGDTITVTVQETNFQSVVPNLISITPTLTGTASMRYE